ncbi:MAG: hypothetical protein ABFR95_01225 [Actinomycetota bacterium]
MKRVSNSIAAAILVLAVAMSSCEGSPVPVEIEIELEARWQCDVQRMTFEDLAALDVELGQRISEAGLTRADYNAFKEDLSDSAELRADVSAKYAEYCDQ